jgi:hypothetical protein
LHHARPSATVVVPNLAVRIAHPTNRHVLNAEKTLAIEAVPQIQIIKSCTMESKFVLIAFSLIVLVALGFCTFKIGPFKSEGSDLCGNCGKNACDVGCSANPKNQVDTADGSQLKSLVPSCSLYEGQMLARKSFLQATIAKKISKVVELETGYDLIFEDQPKEFSKELLEFINFERGCCSSFSFGLLFEPHDKATHLQMYGSEEIKQELTKGFIEVGFLKN